MTSFEILTLVISIVALIFSAIAFFDNYILAKRGFNRNYRPYVFALTYGYRDELTNSIKSTMNHIMIVTVNAPALIKSQKLSFYKRDNGEDIRLYDVIVGENILIYPAGATQHTLSIDPNLINHQIALDLAPLKLIRKIEIEYTWIDKHSESYFFNSEYQYSFQSQSWEGIMDKAN